LGIGSDSDATGAGVRGDGGDIDVSIPLAPVTDVIGSDGHVNFFLDVEDGKRQGGVNPEAAQETKAEQEDYEKKIGYLVYLGQDSEEHSKNKPWYAKIDRNRSLTSTATSSSSVKGVVDEGFDKIKQFEESGYLQGLSKVS
jgi:hypothetical protein